MRSNEELMQGILQRKAFYLVQRQARRLFILAAGLTSLLGMALLSVSGVSGQVEQQRGSVLGATILGPDAGGYVIVALLAFALGIAVSLICLKRKQMKALEDTKEERTNE